MYILFNVDKGQQPKVYKQYLEQNLDCEVPVINITIYRLLFLLYNGGHMGSTSVVLREILVKVEGKAFKAKSYADSFIRWDLTQDKL